jgi:hypothetical protein
MHRGAFEFDRSAQPATVVLRFVGNTSMKLRTLHLTGLVVLAAIITVLVLAYTTVWHVAVYSVLPCLSGVLGMILALAVLPAWLRTRTKDSSGLNSVRKVLLLASVFLLLQAAYLPIARGIRDLEVKRTQDLIGTLILRIEEYERLHGEYPANLDSVLTGDERVPRLLQLSGDFPMAYDNRQYYFQRGATYGFRFYVPDGFIGFQYEYCCGVDGIWTVTD